MRTGKRAMTNRRCWRKPRTRPEPGEVRAALDGYAALAGIRAVDAAGERAGRWRHLVTGPDPGGTPGRLRR